MRMLTFPPVLCGVFVPCHLCRRCCGNKYSGFSNPYTIMSAPVGNVSDPLVMTAVVNATNSLIADLSATLPLPPSTFVGPTWLQGQGVCVSSNALLLGLPPPIVVCRVMWCAVREERRLARVSEPLTVPDFLLFLTSLCSCRVS